MSHTETFSWGRFGYGGSTPALASEATLASRLARRGTRGLVRFGERYATFKHITKFGPLILLLVG